MKRWFPAVLVVGFFIPLPCPVAACSLCGSAFTKQTLRNEIKQSKMVLYGWMGNPQLGGAGAGMTELHVEKILKSHPALGDKRLVIVPQYIPVLDPKSPP